MATGNVYMGRSGDFVGFSSYDCLGWGINLATLGIPRIGLSHCGVVVDQPPALRGPEPPCGWPKLLCESTTTPRWSCQLAKRPISGVQFQELGGRVQEYNGAVWLYRQVKPLRPTEVDKLWAFAVGHAGVDYDAIGAFRARGAGFGWLDRLLLRRKEDLTSIFCSEFVAAALRHVGLFHTANASRWSPNKLGRALLAGGKYGKPIRLK